MWQTFYGLFFITYLPSVLPGEPLGNRRGATAAAVCSDSACCWRGWHPALQASRAGGSHERSPPASPAAPLTLAGAPDEAEETRQGTAVALGTRDPTCPTRRGGFSLWALLSPCGQRQGLRPPLSGVCFGPRSILSRVLSVGEEVSCLLSRSRLQFSGQ